ncbi:MAG TPA: biotin--[acetyl-CoA-carboxylase] ligase [Stellaceae bacterium]|jgi:BirA family biotin operon repressor/biotin-[acetyl-CoA-carboxylase] ligase|nr:biotin--[acetyl-CoA-carboxylase] ligase [Stellaceae bacterium]
MTEGFRLLRYETLGSTNDEAKRLAREGAAAGTIVYAMTQTAGRGRRGREWVSPATGNLYSSLLWRPDCPVASAAQLGFVAALAVADGLDPLLPPGARLRLKWPNDVLLNGKKVSGILLESETGGAALDFVVVGIGVNLASSPRGTETAATSLAEEGVTGVSPETMLAGLTDGFARWEGRWRQNGFPAVRAAWLARAGGLGEDIRVRLERETLHGRFLDLDEAGALLLGQESGQRRIAAGDIFPIAGW